MSGLFPRSLIVACSLFLARMIWTNWATLPQCRHGAAFPGLCRCGRGQDPSPGELRIEC